MVAQILREDPSLVNASKKLDRTGSLFVGIPMLTGLEIDHPDVMEQISELNKMGFNALQIAAFHDNSDLCRLLALSGADLEATAVGDFTALHIASVRGSTNVLPLLVRQGAKINGKSDAGFTPLHVAVAAYQLQAVRCLVEAGADPEMTNRFGLRPLDMASGAFRETLKKYLMKPEAGSDLNG